MSKSYPPRYPQGYPPVSEPNPRDVDELESIILAWQMLLKLAPAAAYGRYVPGRSKQTCWSATGLGTSQRQLRYVDSGVPSHQQRLSCPGHERSVYRMSSGAGRLLRREERGPYPAVPGIGHEEAGRTTVAQRGPIKGRGTTPSARPVRCMPSHCIAADSSHIGASESDVAPGVRRNLPTRPVEQGRTKDCRLYGH